MGFKPPKTDAEIAASAAAKAAAEAAHNAKVAAETQAKAANPLAQTPYLDRLAEASKPRDPALGPRSLHV